MRFAKEIWRKYQNDEHNMQDIVETGLGAIGSAGYQALFTDMSPEEIALATGVGAGAAMLARPTAGHIGKYIGRGLDATVAKPHQQAIRDFGVNLVDSGRQIYGQPGTPVRDAVDAGLQAKYRKHYLHDDGTQRGVLEGFLKHQGHQRGDNAAQALVALTTPMILGTDEEVV